MTLLGLDVGDVRIGVALSDPNETIAFPHGAIMRGPAAFDEIERLVQAENVRGLVVGLPRRLDGTLGPQAEATQAFIHDWQSYLNEHDRGQNDGQVQRAQPAIIWWDERLSSVAAQQAIRQSSGRGKRRKTQRAAEREAARREIDATAAALILQGFLDYHRNTSGNLSGNTGG